MTSSLCSCLRDRNPGVLALSVILVSLGLTLGPLSPAQAQRLLGGIRGGPAFGFLNDSGTPFVSEPGRTTARSNVRIDLHVGVHLIVPFTEHWAVQPEVQFVRKGGHLSRIGANVYTAEQYRFSYVQGHLLVRRRLPIPGPLSGHVVAGGTVARATGSIVQRQIRTSTLEAAERIDLQAHRLVRRWDVGGLIGGGVGYPVGTGTIALELRYNPGLRSLFTSAERPADQQDPYGLEPPPLSATPPNLRHDVILVTVSYTVPLMQ